MFNDVKDPAVCGAKEPKIASLLWVLHDNPNEENETTEEILELEQKQCKKGIISWLGQLFK